MEYYITVSITYVLLLPYYIILFRSITNNISLEIICRCTNICGHFRAPAIEVSFFSQGMYQLPKSLSIRFWFYVTVLPIVEKIMMYLLFLSGAMLLVWSIVKILSQQTKKSSSEWLEMERKRRKSQNDKQIDPKAKDMDVYSSFLTSNNPNLMLMVWLFNDQAITETNRTLFLQ